MSERPKIFHPDSPSARAESWLESLRENGYRLTESRRAIVETLVNAEQSLTPADVHSASRQQHGKLGLVSVYRTLEKLEELGLVQRVHRADGCHAYLAAFDGHNHLLLCDSCGRAEIFEGDNLTEFADKLEGESGFHIREHILQFNGLCQDCFQPKAGQADAPTYI